MGCNMSSWKHDEFTISEIINKIRKGEITVPQYQRGQVWSEEKEDKLIDSIKNGYPFGSILLYEKNANDFHLIDGLQRCTTLYRYISKPARFFNSKTDLSNDLIDFIFELSGLSGEENVIKEKIRTTISDWVIENNETMEDIENVNPRLCNELLLDAFPTLTEYRDQTFDALHEMFTTYKRTCQNISLTTIPAIIYSGDETNLPEVFSRINSQGTILTKYQILAATWSVEKVVIEDEMLFPILEYIEQFYSGIESEGFNIAEDYSDGLNRKEINLYQLLFGFGKYLTSLYPCLFGKQKNSSNVDSVSFNLLNACIANKNKDIKNFPIVLNSLFESDEQINKFLINVLKVTKEAESILLPYLKFKLNSRQDSNNIFHTEMQICSFIANLFLAKHAEIQFDDYDKIIGRKISNTQSRDWRSKFELYKKWGFVSYLCDILNGNWRGTGDTQLDYVSLDRSYYSKRRSRQELESLLDTWFNNINNSRGETSKVASPKNEEKILLSIIYVHKFNIYDQLNSSKYDIEHLCTKILMKNTLKKYKGNLKLPISSFGNLCLLPEWDNRTKKGNTLYSDKKYLETIGEKISIVESKFTFTNQEMFDFLDNDLEENEFEAAYFDFLHKRFEIQKTYILDSLFDQ